MTEPRRNSLHRGTSEALTSTSQALASMPSRTALTLLLLLDGRWRGGRRSGLSLHWGGHFAGLEVPDKLKSLTTQTLHD